MANWIKAIYFVVILAWVIYVLSDDAVKYKSFPRRFGPSVALTVIIGLAGFTLGFFSFSMVVLRYCDMIALR